MRIVVCLTLFILPLLFSCSPEAKTRKKIESLQNEAHAQKYEIGMACMQYILKHGTDLSYSKSLVNILLELGFHAEAMYAAESLLKKHPADAELFYLRSVAHRKQHQYELALKDIGHARELQPGNNTFVREAEQTREAIRMWSEIRLLNQALTNPGDSFAILLQRAEKFFVMQEYDAVLFDLGAASKMHSPEDSIYYSQKVSVLYKDSRRPVETLSEMLEYFKGLE